MPTYASIADLIANNNRQPFATVLVLGAVSVGDGGGGIFVWHPTSAAEANGETVINVSGLTVGRWILIISNSASPTKDKGDLIVNNGTGLARFPLSGVNDRVLTEDATMPLGVKWAAASGGGDTFTKAVLATDFPKTSDAALENVAGFSFAIAANEKWTCTYMLYIAGSVPAQFAVTGPATPTSVLFADVTNNTNFVSAFSSAYAGVGIADSLITLVLNVQNGSNAGTVQLQFAQSTSNPSAITIKAGSTMVAQKVSA